MQEKTWTFHHPTLDDGAKLHSLIMTSKPLDVNSSYFYLLMSRYFSQTCAVAKADRSLVGAVIGLQPPAEPDTLFIWQIAVHPQWRGCGLASSMLKWLVDTTSGLKKLAATVTPDNRASAALFHSFANHFGSRLHVTQNFFSTEHFGAQGHAPESLYEIPLSTTRRQPEHERTITARTQPAAL
ncbi:MAG: diaminobutyrate acetyltransferase [Alicyclobacillus herbarius]|uniref:diaminobutyrate acetyltransferase n=1 Tax=Alicyclobacillus herbarius TaxID=122960 RepID=UPI002352AB3B|nr:diaminobutyrate acetyltransferase [Alicyclobacillus herbarius]MCL6632468.1 diaminobutyrate acetyltransferase [Alicyclobacillus herbarius]